MDTVTTATPAHEEKPSNNVSAGQVREFMDPDGNKALGLVFNHWMETDDASDDTWLVCPVKSITGEDPTGVSLYISGDRETLLQSVFSDAAWYSGYAMPCLGGSVPRKQIETAPVVGQITDAYVDEVWSLFRWNITGDKPDFSFFENPHSDSDWAMARSVLFDPEFDIVDESELDDGDDDGDDEDDGVDVEPEPSTPSKPKFDSRDVWGPCCSGCTWAGQSHKPCAACAG